jgi:hypothetical protein
MVGSLDPPPSTQEPELYYYVENAIWERLDSYDYWPANVFKLELESAGLYQNFTGRCLLELLDNDEVKRIRSNGIPYMAIAGSDPSITGQVKDATDTFYDLVNHDSKPSFSELTLYVAISREKELLGDDVIYNVFPKGHYPGHLGGITNEIDGLIHLNREYFPLQVYSGIQLVTQNENEERDKVDQAVEVSTEENPPSNPVIVSHLCSENARDIMRSHNGTVIDIQKLLACESTNPDINTAAKFLNIRNRIELIPELEVEHGLELNGEHFDTLVNEYPKAIIPRKVSQAATQLPDWYRQIVRGGLHLLYVNTFYRHARSRIGEQASILLQQAFHHLLRSNSGMNIDQFIAEGWAEFEKRYNYIDQAKNSEDEIRQQARDYVSTLVGQNIVTRSGDTIRARNSSHPHSSLSFPSGY